MLGTKVNHCVQLLFSQVFPYSWKEFETFHHSRLDEGSTSLKSADVESCSFKSASDLSVSGDRLAFRPHDSEKEAK